MSDSDDQDKTRIKPRQKLAPESNGQAVGGVKPQSKPAAPATKTVEGKPVKVAPVKAAPARATPAQAMPARATPAQVTPAKAVPAKATPPQVVPLDEVEIPADTTVFSAKVRSQLAIGAAEAKVAARIANKPRGGDETLSLPGNEPVKTKVASALNLQAHDVLKGRFILERVLGAGGMGVVYKAKDLLKVEAKDRDPYVAIKVLGEEFKSHPEAFIALQRESRKTQRIAHPNIVNVHDFDKDRDTVFMTMEFLEGTPLDKLIKKYRNTSLPLTDVWQILDGICSALAYAHEQNIIHSDLKPGNIFVTNMTIAKVFDFGIARAVAKAEQGDFPDSEDKTVFDAGNLGALTPAYASLEMLEGDPPDVRDDIYALGCITYELFTGEHPYKRKNAKEAKRLGMKPSRIEDITKHQWRVIEQALAFDREDRIGSVKEFWTALTKKYSRPYMLWTTLLLVAIIGGAVIYDQFYRKTAQQQPQMSEEAFRSELEYKIRLELIQENIAKLLETPTFDTRWESALWQQLQNLIQIVTPHDARVVQIQAQAAELYVRQVTKEIESKLYAQAKKHVENGRRYSADQAEFDRLLTAIEVNIAAEAKLQLATEQQQRMAEEKARAENQKKAEEAHKREEYELALANIKEQLQCNILLDMNDFTIALNKLRSINLGYYKVAEGKIIDGLAACINKIGRNFPDRARSARSVALTLFPGNTQLRNIEIADKDSCSISLAGLGARGRKSVCQDNLAGGSKGPELVVIPARGNIKSFALGKYEVSVAEFNTFCQTARVCDPLSVDNTSLPATDISYQMVQEYLAWLSKETGNKYRLPSVEEWTLAAVAKGRGLDSNRNCFLDSRGLQKGGALISAEIGQQNGWGLINYVGNAQEFATAGGGKLMVLGGSYKTDMGACDIDLKSTSKGNADPETGFRILRELTK